MKKTRMYALSAISLLSLALLCGCVDTHREEELEQQVQQLEQQVTDLQKAQDTKTDTKKDLDSDDAEDRAEDLIEKDDDAAADATDASLASPTLEELTQSIASITEEVKKTTPAGASAEQLTQYRALKKEIELLEQQLDDLDDDAEYQFDTGAISREDYRTLDRTIDDLDEQLDNCEDDLERLFGIDD